MKICLKFIATTESPKSTAEEKKPKPLKWDEDMQQYSRFLDRKVKYKYVYNRGQNYFVLIG
jgi:hypothetical protein